MNFFVQNPGREGGIRWPQGQGPGVERKRGSPNEEKKKKRV